ncbi:MAG: class I SAM-dependent methyltransferase [Pseudorhodoplanes sp.]|nr:class I SAM-dependent methyltransferase [Pseudorhodoplanes sp.]
MEVGPDAAGRMDRIYRHQRHIYDVTRRFFLLGRDAALRELQPPRPGAVLEIGCGTGRNLIAAARRYPQALFCGIDISNEMLKSCRRSVARAGLSARIAVAYGDATDFDPARLFARVRFERIFISYSLSMIPRWREVLGQAMTKLAPGGELHIVDFGGQSGLPRAFRAALRRWLALFHVSPRDDLEEALKALAAAYGAGLELRRPFRDYAQLAVVKARA